MKQVVVKPTANESFAFSLGEKHEVLRSATPLKRARTDQEGGYGYDEDRSSGEEDF